MLSTQKFLALADYLRKNKKNIDGQKTISEVVKTASSDLGFNITQSNIRALTNNRRREDNSYAIPIRFKRIRKIKKNTRVDVSEIHIIAQEVYRIQK